MHGKPGLTSSFQTGLHGDHLLQGFRFLFFAFYRLRDFGFIIGSGIIKRYTIFNLN